MAGDNERFKKENLNVLEDDTTFVKCGLVVLYTVPVWNVCL